MLPIKKTLLECIYDAGSFLRSNFRHVRKSRRKENQSSIVSFADVAAENRIIAKIRSRFPGHNIVSEEKGCSFKSNDYTWVIDPLDGSSNFVAGLPWFGVQMALLHEHLPIMAAIYLPMDDILYFCERGNGVLRNGKRIRTTKQRQLSNVLLSFGLDSVRNPKVMRSRGELFVKLARAVRNLRATNSVVDFCYLLDGRIGGIVNMNTKIWDIMPLSLMLPEAQGRLGNLTGGDISFDLTKQNYNRNYEIIGASRVLFPKLATVVGSTSQ